MNIEMMVVVAVITVLASLITVLRVIPWRALVRYHWFADVALTLFLIYLFAGTLSGMIIAAIAGLTFSIILSIGRWLTPHLNEDNPT